MMDDKIIEDIIGRIHGKFNVLWIICTLCHQLRMTKLNSNKRGLPI